MAETPARYCSNCGHELGGEVQFCPNCGTAVHRAAHVPTPEADVPVPPPPQAAAPGAAPTQGAAPEQPAQRGFGRRHPLLTGCLGIIGLLVLLSIIGTALGGGGDETAGGGSGGGAGGGEEAAKEPEQEQEQQPQEAEQKPEKQKPEEQEQQPQEPEVPNFSDGTYQVGTDIKPGTYRTREGTSGCYWERLSGFSGEFNDILANGNTDAPAIIEIKPTDAGFTSQDCGT